MEEPDTDVEEPQDLEEVYSAIVIDGIHQSHRLDQDQALAETLLAEE